MSQEFDAALREVDRDGALENADGRAREAGVDGITRGALLRKAAVLAGGGVALGAIPVGFAAAQGASPATKSPQQDIAILNYALTLEYLEAAFYAEAVKMGKLSGETATFAKVVAQHEAAHVAKLKGALGSSAVPSPSFNFRGVPENMSKFQQTAASLEEVGTTAYLGQAANIQNPQYLVVAGTILCVEARHTAWMNDIIGRGSSPSPAPAAFQPYANMATVLGEVKALNFITGGLSSSVASEAQSGQPSMTG